MNEFLNKPALCNHAYIEGIGSVDDAVVCCYCGVEEFPEMVFGHKTPDYILAWSQGRVVGPTHPLYKEFAAAGVAARNLRLALENNCNEEHSDL